MQYLSILFFVLFVIVFVGFLRVRNRSRKQLEELGFRCEKCAYMPKPRDEEMIEKSLETRACQKCEHRLEIKHEQIAQGVETGATS